MATPAKRASQEEPISRTLGKKSQRDSARARAKAKATNKRNKEFDQEAKALNDGDRFIRSLKNKGLLSTGFDRLTTSEKERDIREAKRVANLKSGRTRAGEKLIAERGKVRDAETKARVNKAGQAQADKSSAFASGRPLNAAEKSAKADMARREQKTKETDAATKKAREDSAKASTGVLLSSMSPKTARAAKALINSRPTAANKVNKANPINKKRMTDAEVEAMKSSPLNRRDKANRINKKKMTEAEVDTMKANPLNKGIGKSEKSEKFGVGDKFVIRGNKANVTDTQLKKTGLTQAQYMKKWRASNKRPTAASSAKTTAKTTKTPKKVGFLRRVLLGKDGKFGGARGAIDFLPGKSRKKKEDKPVNKMGGGMMKSKMSSKGGKRGGMSNGGLAMTKVNGKSVPAFAADGKGANDLAPTRRNMGGMMKSKGMSKGGAMKSKGMSKGGAMKSKGMSKGGAMKKKGYANGGAVRSKMASKGGKRGGVSRKATKPRGVGVAKRGFGKAMR